VSGTDPYSPRVRDLFSKVPRAGPLAPGQGVIRCGEAMALERGAWVRFEARVEAGVVVEARFRAWGCPHLLAASALAAGRLEGWAPGAGPGLDAATLAADLQVPAEKLGRLLVVEDAVTALAAATAPAD